MSARVRTDFDALLEATFGDLDGEVELGVVETTIPDAAARGRSLLDAEEAEADEPPVRRHGPAPRKNRRVPKDPGPAPFDEHSGMTREEHRRFRAYLDQRGSSRPRDPLPTTSWMDFPYPDQRTAR